MYIYSKHTSLSGYFIIRLQHYFEQCILCYGGILELHKSHPLLHFLHDMLLLIVSGVGVRFVTVQAELASIPAMALEVLAELAVLFSDGILADVGNAEEGDESRQQCQRGGDPEGILSNLCRIVAASCFDVGEDPSSDKGTNLANGSGNAVVTATDTSSAGLGGQKTNVVAGAKLSETQENTIDDGEASNVLRDLVIDTSHNVADNSLQTDANDQGVLGADVVANKGTNHGSGNVEQVDDGVPPENSSEGRSLGIDAGQDRRGVDAECIGRELGTKKVNIHDLVKKGSELRLTS